MWHMAPALWSYNELNLPNHVACISLNILQTGVRHLHVKLYSLCGSCLFVFCAGSMALPLTWAQLFESRAWNKNLTKDFISFCLKRFLKLPYSSYT